MIDNNKFMGAVDRCNQMVAYSCFRRRTMKWWKKVFFHLFFLTILNAYILYKEGTQSPVLHRNFCRELVKELITSSGISPSLTPRGPPRRLAVGLTRLQPGACFSKVPKLFGPILGTTIPFISSQRRSSKPSNFAILLIFLILRACKKISFSKRADCSLTTSFSGPKSSRDFRETGP